MAFCFQSAGLEMESISPGPHGVFQDSRYLKLWVAILPLWMQIRIESCPLFFSKGFVLVFAT